MATSLQRSEQRLQAIFPNDIYKICQFDGLRFRVVWRCPRLPDHEQNSTGIQSSQDRAKAHKALTDILCHLRNEAPMIWAQKAASLACDALFLNLSLRHILQSLLRESQGRARRRSMQKINHSCIADNS
jgi:hypothetical protein